MQYQERGKERVSEKEKEILETMAEALTKMDDMKKGELLGYSKAMLDLNHQKERENEHEEAGE